jgi:flavodoxin
MSTLIVYFSQSGNTKKLAELIHSEVGGDLREIGAVDVAAYDRIYVGTPNHASTAAPNVITFLKERDFSGKIVIPFVTHGMGGLQDVAKAITEAVPNATVLEPFAVKGVEVDGATENVKAWLLSVNS